jgi:hypothetical protein
VKSETRTIQGPHALINSIGQSASPREHDFASSPHDRRSPPRMHRWDHHSGAAGPEVACDTGALSRTRSRTRRPAGSATWRR